MRRDPLHASYVDDAARSLIRYSPAVASTSALKTARAARDELTRQLLLEKRYDYLAGPDASGFPKVGKSVTRALAGFAFGVTLEGRLDILREAADRVLVRADAWCSTSRSLMSSRRIH